MPGYCSEANLHALERRGIDAYIATGRQTHGERLAPAPRGRPPAGLTRRERMARKLRTLVGRAVYARRKAIVEPVFGQIKHARRFRQFLRRGWTAVRHEWALICTVHNLLKLHTAGRLAMIARRARRPGRGPPRAPGAAPHSVAAARPGFKTAIRLFTSVPCRPSLRYSDGLLVSARRRAACTTSQAAWTSASSGRRVRATSWMASYSWCLA